MTLSRTGLPRRQFTHIANGHGHVRYVTKPGSGEALAAIVETIERFWIAVAQLPRVLR